MIRKLLALVLSVMMIVSAVPVQVLAAPSAFTAVDTAMDVVVTPEEFLDDSAEKAEDGVEKSGEVLFDGLEEEAEISAENETETTSDNVGVVESGIWGGIDWTLTSDGTLTIAPTKGTPAPDKSGKTYEVGQWRETVTYSPVAYATQPFAKYNAQITKLVIEEGVTSIGSFAMRNMTNIEQDELVIPSTVTYIGQESLKNLGIGKLTFANGGEEEKEEEEEEEELCIGVQAFNRCTMEEIVFPEDRPVHIHCWAFTDCTSLKGVYFPANVKGFPAYTHVEYMGMDWVNGGSNSYDSQVLARCNALESLSFGSEDVKTLFYNGYGNSSNISAIGNVATLVAPKARIGAIAYATLEGAIAEAQSGDTVTLLADVTLSEKLTISNNVTISGEYTITRADNYTGTLFTVNAGATLTLDGGLVVDGNNEWTLNEELYNKALNLEVSGTTWADLITSEEGKPNATAPMFKVTGSVVAKNVTIQNNYSSKSSNGGDYGVFQVDANATLTMTGATIKHIVTGGANSVAHLSTNSVWTINDDSLITDTFAGKNGGICRNDGGFLVMNGGEVSNNKALDTNGTFVMLYKGTMEMNGGKICSNSGISGSANGRCAPIYGHSTSTFVMTGGEICHNTGVSYGGVDVPSSIKAEISGGYIGENISALGNANADINGNSNTVISGGTFTQDVSKWCDDGFILEYDEENGTYGVAEDPAYGKVAKIGEEYYEKLADALAAAKDDDTVTLLADVVLTESLINNKKITLDLAGKTISQEKACTASYEMISNKGTLTIKDSVGGGKIGFKDTGAGDPTFGWGSYTIRNEGTLVVENGTVEHLGQQNATAVSHMYCAIF